MPVTGGIALNLSDWSKQIDPDGQTADVVELLNQTNDVLLDMQWIEGNLPTGHRTTVATGLPNVAWRLLNNGITPSKSTTAQLDESCGMLEAWCEVDKDLAELNGNTASFRLSQARRFIEAMNQTWVQTLFYGNTAVNPERFLGLSPRFSTIAAAQNGQNVLSGGGTGAVNASIWHVVWGEETCIGIFPKGSPAGLIHEDMGLQTVENAVGITGARMRAYRERWQWKAGLALRDWRYVVRVPNIDTNNLVAETNNADIVEFMSRCMDRIPSYGMGRPVYYLNRTIFSWLRIQAQDKSTQAIAIQPGLDQFGNPTSGQLSFMGIPIRRCDQLLNTEAAVA